MLTAGGSLVVSRTRAGSATALFLSNVPFFGAAGAPQQHSGQKPRFLPAGHGAMSAQIAAGNLCQSTIIRALFTAEDP